MIAEIDAQVGSLKTYFASPTEANARKILSRGGYSHNLKMRIHDSCYDQIASQDEGDAETLLFRAVETIATNLDVIAELCRECVQQATGLTNQDRLKDDHYELLLERVLSGFELINRAISGNKTPIALKLGKIEYKLGQTYKKLSKKYTAELKRSRETKDLITSLFIAYSIDQMGDALLNISEAVISVNVGQNVDTERYHSLQASVSRLNETLDSNLVVETIAETRSGSSISAISTADSDDQKYLAVYKEGQKQKLKEERQSVESWHEIYPGLAPKILAYHKHGQSASLLIEHLAGFNFEQILLHKSPELLQEALGKLQDTLVSVWTETRSKKPVQARFMAQMRSRLNEVYAVHPEFRKNSASICGFQVAAFDTLAEQAQNFEAVIKPPFSVYIHGDFNADNIIYDPKEKRINFIDLHRSRSLDFVQDVSVFMVSSFRLQILDVPMRRKIMRMIRDFYNFAAGFADHAGDDSFDLRLALGLARSFATSTRFILDKTLAKSMFLRSRYLIEQILETHPKNASSYHLPIEEIFVG